MKKTALAAALMIATGSVHAAAVSSLTVTAGGFGMEEPPNPVNNWSGELAFGVGAPGGAILIDDAFNFNGFLGLVDIVATGAGLSGDVTGGALTLDLSEFGIIWNNGLVGQGPTSNYTQTYNSSTGAFTASWSSLISGSPGGAFDGKTGNWSMEGTVNVVPIPAAAWLFGTGLVGLVGIARRRRKAA